MQGISKAFKRYLDAVVRCWEQEDAKLSQVWSGRGKLCPEESVRQGQASSLWRLRKAVQLRQRALQESGAQAVSRLIANTRNGKVELEGKLASVTCRQRRTN